MNTNAMTAPSVRSLSQASQAFVIIDVIATIVDKSTHQWGKVQTKTKVSYGYGKPGQDKARVR